MKHTNISNESVVLQYVYSISFQVWVSHKPLQDYAVHIFHTYCIYILKPNPHPKSLWYTLWGQYVICAWVNLTEFRMMLSLSGWVRWSVPLWGDGDTTEGWWSWSGLNQTLCCKHTVLSVLHVAADYNFLPSASEHRCHKLLSV